MLKEVGLNLECVCSSPIFESPYKTKEERDFFEDPQSFEIQNYKLRVCLITGIICNRNSNYIFSV